MTSWARSRAPSLPMIRLTWVLAVSGLRPRLSAIPVLLRPRATRDRTWHSRSESTPRPSGPGPAGALGALSTRAMSRAVGPGESRESPAATVLIAASRSAGRVSLTRKPEAPARSASTMWSSVS